MGQRVGLGQYLRDPARAGEPGFDEFGNFTGQLRMPYSELTPEQRAVVDYYSTASLRETAAGIGPVAAPSGARIDLTAPGALPMLLPPPPPPVLQTSAISSPTAAPADSVAASYAPATQSKVVEVPSSSVTLLPPGAPVPAAVAEEEGIPAWVWLLVLGGGVYLASRR